MADENLEKDIVHGWIDHIPAIWVDPGSEGEQRRLAIWLPGLTGTKYNEEGRLRELATRGFVALSFDPWQHGERGNEDRDQMVTRVFGNFRRQMWPILAHTTEDCLRVIDWAIANLGVSPAVVMGGISMGGDISVAVAGLEPRIGVVAAIIATPDWLRPGMNIPPGEPDAYSWLMYNRLNPLTHLDQYNRCPAITFECGAQDNHVPPDGALRFQQALKSTYQACPDRLRVTLHPGLGHEFGETMWANSLEWLTRW